METSNKSGTNTGLGDGSTAAEAIRLAAENERLRAELALQAEALRELRLSEERWNFALHGTGDGVWDYDVVDQQVFLSRRAKELLSQNDDELSTPETRSRAIHPDDLERARETIRAHMCGETPTFSCEFRAKHRDGHYLWILARGRVMARDEQGNPLRLVGTYKDISERRRVQDELEQREATLREFIAHTPAAIAVLDNEVRYLQVSQRWLVDYKLEGQDVIGRSHYEVFPDIPERWKQIHQRVLQGTVESCDEDPFPRQDGTLDWLQWEVRPWYDRPNHIGGLIFFTQVITPRKQMELALEERNLALSRTNAELEQFAYVASHDLQEPLRAVAGCTQLLAERHKGQLDAETDTLIAHIVDGSARMKALIEGLLSLSRLKFGQRPTTMVDAGLVLGQARQNLAARIATEGATIAAGALPHVRADGLQLLQLFQNLVGNALKYRRQVPVEVSISAVKTHEGFQFSVRDNGIGIDAKYFERIFGVFQRLHTREEYPGTGIGLAICRKIVDRHGGRIWVESTPGAGSTFHFTVPD